MSRNACYESRDELETSQQSCMIVGMRCEYMWKCTKLWRCQSMHKRCMCVRGHKIMKVMC